MELKAEEIQSNWDKMLGYINTYISDPRKEKVIEFYNKFSDRIVMMPASHKKEYHNAFPGGYVDHVNRVIEASLKLYDVWCEFEMDRSTFTVEELVFSALNHDLGKMGDSEHESYIPQTDKWRQDKLGEDYMHNKKIAFASVPDRGLFLLQEHGIQYTFNEMVAIQTHDGLYDPANEKYLKSYMPETKPRTSLPFILHQADMMAARVEFEKEWLPKFSNPEVKEKIKSNNKTNIKTKALGSIKSEGLKDMLNSL
jgi:hypothetical protein|tara:strand:+ start:3755 stop:4516 length:762 start_codon:yes stop_codon:yes gene_type:complete